MRFLTAIIAGLGFLNLASAELVYAGEPQWRSYTTLTGPSKYGDNFKHYDYVNPQAPKGGTLNLIAIGTFNSLNPYVVEGMSAAGLAPFGGGLLYDTLMSQAMDQSGISYPLIAEAVQYPDDFSWVKYRLRTNATWHDGQPITAEDVVWSFNQLKKFSPYYSRYYLDIEKAEVTGDHEVTFTFKSSGNRELPNIVGDLVILPKHWWEGTDKNGNKRNITKVTMEVPLGSSAYRIDSFNAGKNIIWKRVENYWGANLPINIGRNNYGTIRYRYFLDNNAEWEAFKKGGLVDYRQDTSIQSWMQKYDFSAVKDGQVIRKTFPYHSVGRMQGYFLNLRREKFADIRVRKALTLAFDFEQMNRTLFFDKYLRINSYFAGIDIASTGLPNPQELAILEMVRGKVPDEVFTREFSLPNYDSPKAARDHLGEAMQLMEQAGWTLRNNRLVNAKGEPFTIEFLLDQPVFERVTALYVANLKRLGIDATIRTVDASQYQNRRNNFDFDVISGIIAQSTSPGNEQIDYFGSKSADIAGSRNFSGIKNPAVDTIIKRIIYARSRDELVSAARALDRVLLWNYYVVPQWYLDSVNVAYWDKFGMPEKQPDTAGYDFLSWWIDPAKEAALMKR